MVLFVDLEDESAEPPETITLHWYLNRGLKTANVETLDPERVNPNRNATTEALCYYPFVHTFTHFHHGHCTIFYV